MVDDASIKFCPNCGDPVSPTDAFCGRCGTNISVQAPPTLPYSPPRKRSRAAGPIVFIVVFIVLMLVMLNLPHSFLNEGGSSDTNGAANSSYSSGNGTRSITWKYDGDTYTLKFSIDQAKYLNYVNNPVARRMTSNNDYALGLQFITSNDSLILSIAAQLSSLKDQAGLDRSGEANLALSFVQTIPYAFDNVTYGKEDYWAFPVETLYHYQGDCEDKSFLYTSIMEDLNYDCALLFFSDHVAVGVAFSSVPGGTYYAVNSVQYYYSETTSIGWTVGEKPEDYGDSHVIVV